LQDALVASTGLKFDDAAGWRSWWRSKGKLGRRCWLEDALLSAEPKNRARAAQLLFREGTVESVSMLLKGLSDEYSGVRASSARALRRVTGLGFKYDADAAEDERQAAIKRWRSWWARAEKLGRRGWLLDALGGSSVSNRSRAARGLAEYRDREVARALIRALTDEAGGVREAAWYTLTRFAGDSYDYDPDAPPVERERIAGRFLAWWGIEFAGQRVR
jgi:hypothetical protein